VKHLGKVCANRHSSPTWFRTTHVEEGERPFPRWRGRENLWGRSPGKALKEEEEPFLRCFLSSEERESKEEKREGWFRRHWTLETGEPAWQEERLTVHSSLYNIKCPRSSPMSFLKLVASLPTLVSGVWRIIHRKRCSFSFLLLSAQNKVSALRCELALGLWNKRPGGRINQSYVFTWSHYPPGGGISCHFTKSRVTFCKFEILSHQYLQEKKFQALLYTHLIRLVLISPFHVMLISFANARMPLLVFSGCILFCTWPWKLFGLVFFSPFAILFGEVLRPKRWNRFAIWAEFPFRKPSLHMRSGRGSSKMERRFLTLFCIVCSQAYVLALPR